MSAPNVLIVEYDTLDVAPAAQEPSPGYECDMCGQHFEGDPAGSGLFLWSRGDELRVEEPPLCETCAMNVTLDALTRWEVEEEEEG